jgi:hypothetical protein
VKIMRWCLRVKLAQNWREFSRLLLATGERNSGRNRDFDNWPQGLELSCIFANDPVVEIT